MGAKDYAEMKERMGSKKPNLQNHGNNLKEHGKELKEQVSGKKCPHCGKPI